MTNAALSAGEGAWGPHSPPLQFAPRPPPPGCNQASSAPLLQRAPSSTCIGGSRHVAAPGLGERASLRGRVDALHPLTPAGFRQLQPSSLQHDPSGDCLALHPEKEREEEDGKGGEEEEEDVPVSTRSGSSPIPELPIDSSLDEEEFVQASIAAYFREHGASTHVRLRVLRHHTSTRPHALDADVLPLGSGAIGSSADADEGDSLSLHPAAIPFLTIAIPEVQQELALLKVSAIPVASAHGSRALPRLSYEQWVPVQGDSPRVQWQLFQNPNTPYCMNMHRAGALVGPENVDMRLCLLTLEDTFTVEFAHFGTSYSWWISPDEQHLDLYKRTHPGARARGALVSRYFLSRDTFAAAPKAELLVGARPGSPDWWATVYSLPVLEHLYAQAVFVPRTAHLLLHPSSAAAYLVAGDTLLSALLPQADGALLLRMGDSPGLDLATIWSSGPSSGFNAGENSSPLASQSFEEGDPSSSYSEATADGSSTDDTSAEPLPAPSPRDHYYELHPPGSANSAATRLGMSYVYDRDHWVLRLDMAHPDSYYLFTLSGPPGSGASLTCVHSKHPHSVLLRVWHWNAVQILLPNTPAGRELLTLLFTVILHIRHHLQHHHRGGVA